MLSPDFYECMTFHRGEFYTAGGDLFTVEQILDKFSPYKRGSEVRALCIECGGKCEGDAGYTGVDCVYDCTNCQDGQALYRITGEVQLKQFSDIATEKSGEDLAAAIRALGVQAWVCISPAEIVKPLEDIET